MEMLNAAVTNLFDTLLPLAQREDFSLQQTLTVHIYSLEAGDFQKSKNINNV